MYFKMSKVLVAGTARLSNRCTANCAQRQLEIGRINKAGRCLIKGIAKKTACRVRKRKIIKIRRKQKGCLGF